MEYDNTSSGNNSLEIGNIPIMASSYLIYQIGKSFTFNIFSSEDFCFIFY